MADIKTAAAKVFFDGDVTKAIEMYSEALKVLELMPQQGDNKRRIAQEEAALYNQLAFCCSKFGGNHAEEIDYSSKTIKRAPYLSDMNVAMRAYLRRGLAYEQVKEFNKAVFDLKKVLEIDEKNKNAKMALSRCQKETNLQVAKEEVAVEEKFEQAEIDAAKAEIKKVRAREDIRDFNQFAETAGPFEVARQANLQKKRYQMADEAIRKLDENIKASEEKTEVEILIQPPLNPELEAVIEEKVEEKTDMDALNDQLTQSRFLGGAKPSHVDLALFTKLKSQKQLPPDLMKHMQIFIWSTFMEAYSKQEKPQVPLKRRIIFLDIEGVLSSRRCIDRQFSASEAKSELVMMLNCPPMERRNVEQLKRLVNKTQKVNAEVKVEIVLTTPWRLLEDKKPFLTMALENIDGVIIAGNTPAGTDRGTEIKDWLLENKDVCGFVVLDALNEESIGLELPAGHFVWTLLCDEKSNPETEGLTSHKADMAYEMLVKRFDGKELL